MQLYRHRKISDDLLCLRNRDAEGAELEAAKGFATAYLRDFDRLEEGWTEAACDRAKYTLYSCGYQGERDGPV
ncbi:hypothetical protein WJX75_009319 [Coccomyxa subellipsoidea]|uniref:Uncharacterized protein n=1 Tax=Coccomyxa subellipsoidea TaxID=248742 RepID=A0ABR2Z6A6_9CHLO